MDHASRRLVNTGRSGSEWQVVARRAADYYRSEIKNFESKLKTCNDGIDKELEACILRKQTYELFTRCLLDGGSKKECAFD
jgi:hypothetical protein